mmetsp:Transcript_3191/g.9156  ORF Transcript_3191/g.9156 Transcript_3191/m.9156 type:complete len:446 (+) Transcript_3191:477-1814(+)
MQPHVCCVTYAGSERNGESARECVKATVLVAFAMYQEPRCLGMGYDPAPPYLALSLSLSTSPAVRIRARVETRGKLRGCAAPYVSLHGDVAEFGRRVREALLVLEVRDGVGEEGLHGAARLAGLHILEMLLDELDEAAQVRVSDVWHLRLEVVYVAVQDLHEEVHVHGGRHAHVGDLERALEAFEHAPAVTVRALDVGLARPEEVRDHGHHAALVRLLEQRRAMLREVRHDAVEVLLREVAAEQHRADHGLQRPHLRAAVAQHLLVDDEDLRHELVCDVRVREPVRRDRRLQEHLQRHLGVARRHGRHNLVDELEALARREGQPARQLSLGLLRGLGERPRVGPFLRLLCRRLRCRRRLLEPCRLGLGLLEPRDELQLGEDERHERVLDAAHAAEAEAPARAQVHGVQLPGLVALEQVHDARHEQLLRLEVGGRVLVGAHLALGA